MSDPALDTLLLPFATRALAWPETGPILFLRARMGQALMQPEVPRERFICHQTFQPFARDLSAANFSLTSNAAGPVGSFRLTLALPPRQRDEARYLLS